MDLERLVIVRPSGNITALVFDEIPQAWHRAVGEAIQTDERYSKVEQVLFVQEKHGRKHGQMAGGEFCGNAARSLGYVLAKEQEDTQTFTMSGIEAPVTIEVRPGFANLKMDTHLQREKMVFGGAPLTIVHMEGISHAVMFPRHPLFNLLSNYAARNEREATIKHVLEDLRLLERPAAGLIFARKIPEGLKINPYVFVRDIETLYPETACASGSVAVASIFGKGIHVLQPSGETLDIKIKRINGNVKAEIAGKMEIISDGAACNLSEPRPLERDMRARSPSRMTDTATVARVG